MITALLAGGGCGASGLEGAVADSLVGAQPLAALPWGLPGLTLGVIAGLYARPEGRTGKRQQRTGYFAILALIAAGVCARAMLGPRWQLGYGLLFGGYAIAGLAAGRLWNPRQRHAAVAGAAGIVVATFALAVAVPTWTAATPFIALAAAAASAAAAVAIAARVKPLS